MTSNTSKIKLIKGRNLAQKLPEVSLKFPKIELISRLKHGFLVLMFIVGLEK
jgi:hypothetical protein